MIAIGGDDGWTPTEDRLPARGEIVDWMDSQGNITRGGMYDRLWFAPPDHAMYVYFVPTFWRPSTR